MKEPVKFINYSGIVFRVFSTVYPSQDLLDDILPQAEDRKVAKKFYYSPHIPDTLTRQERILRRSISSIIQKEISEKFNPKNWNKSRYSDGTWEVFYSAQSEKTALKESIYHKRKMYREEILQKAVVIDLNSASLEINSNHCIDLNLLSGVNKSKLTSQDESGYPYCQKLTKRLRNRGAELFKAPSARDRDGVCIPIFVIQVIQTDSGPLKPLKCILRKEGTEVFVGGNIIRNLD